MEHKLKAIVSTKIIEDNVIRLGKRTRDTINTNINKYLDIWKNPFVSSKLCEIHQAFDSDIKKIPPNERDTVAFVSQSMYDMFVKDGHIDISSKKSTCIGSDPEFIVFCKEKGNQDVIIQAADILAFESQIGSDGPLGELRADPGATPKEHVNNLEGLISNIYNEVDQNKYTCKIFPYLVKNFIYLHEYDFNPLPSRENIVTCGGHIHLGLTPKLKVGGIYNIIPYIFDRLVTVCMHRVDRDMSYKRINEGGYGNLIDYKSGNISLEYRGLSGTWLLYKDLATVVLSIVNSLTEAVADKITRCFNDPNDLNWDIKNKCVAPHQIIADIEKVTLELFPTLTQLYSDYSYDELGVIFTSNSNSTKVLRYINKSLECLDSIIDEPELGAFSELVTANYNDYKKFDPNFIENWNSGISVFDHLNS